MITQITVGGQVVNLVSFDGLRAPRSVEFTFKDAVAANTSPFTGVTQTYTWPGADMWCPPNKPGVITLPRLTQPQADAWLAALMECRGMANPFLMGDPLKKVPAGNVIGCAPTIDNATAGTNLTGQTKLYTKAWTPLLANALLPGDYFQVGYRLHRNLTPVMVDANGKAVLNVWPSLREPYPDAVSQVGGVLTYTAQPLVLANPRGLFRLASNERTWSSTIGALTSLSFQIMEYR